MLCRAISHRSVAKVNSLRSYSTKVRESKNFINGEWQNSKTDKWIDLVQPSTGKVIVKVPESTPQELASATEAAQTAFESWSQVPLPQRVRTLFEYRRRLNDNLDKIADNITEELGKTKADARGDVLRGLEVVEYGLSAAEVLLGNTSSNIASNVDVHSYQVPLGVCAGVCPFNFPAMIPLWMFPLAIVAGNSFIIKPSEKDPGGVEIMTELARGIWPDGVLNVVHGGKQTVDFICDAPEIKAISFVGGGHVGNYIHERGSQNGKKVQSNMAAKNHCVIMPDASKQRTLDAIVSSAFGATGQRCMALPVAIFVGDSQDWIPDLIERASKLVCGPGHMDVDISPVVTKESQLRIERLIEEGSQSANLVLDGRNPKVPEGFEGGNWVGATILDNVQSDHSCYQEEIFGPVLCIIRANTIDEAIEMINKNPYGNGTALFTSSGAAARHFQHNINCGQVGINLPVPVPPPFFSFSGNKASHIGASNFYGKNGFRFYTQTKTVMSNWWADDLSTGVRTAMPVLGRESETDSKN